MATLKQALVESGAVDAFPNPIKVRYIGKGTRKVFTLPRSSTTGQRVASTAPSSVVFVGKPEGPRSRGGMPPRIKSSKVWEQCAIYGVQSGWGSSQFGKLTGFYRQREEAGGQGSALKGVL